MHFFANLMTNLTYTMLINSFFVWTAICLYFWRLLFFKILMSFWSCPHLPSTKTFSVIQWKLFILQGMLVYHHYAYHIYFWYKFLIIFPSYLHGFCSIICFHWQLWSIKSPSNNLLLPWTLCYHQNVMLQSWSNFKFNFLFYVADGH